MNFRELVEKKEVKFKKEAPNGHFYLISVMVPKKDADKLIKNIEHKKGGWYKFDVKDNGDVIVGNNLWTDLDLNKYPKVT